MAVNFKMGFMLSCALSISQACSSQTNILFEYDMESGDLIKEGLNSGVDTGHGNPPQIVPERARSGTYSMRSYVNRLTSESSYRSEVSLDNHNGQRYASFGEDYWYGFSIYIPQDYQPVSVWEVLAQWHGWPDQDIREGWRNPPLNLNSGPDGVWQVVSRWDARKNTFVTGQLEYGGVQRWKLDPLDSDRGNWVDWVFHVKWSWQDDGVLEVWKDGRQVIQHSGPNAYNDALGPYFKMGVYLGWKDRACCEEDPVERLFFHDELRIAIGEDAGYTDVSPAEPRENGVSN